MELIKSVKLHPHAFGRLAERGATVQEVQLTVQGGERFLAKHGRTGFRRHFVYSGEWRGHHYETKQVEVYAVEEGESWLAITVITKYF